MARRTGTRPPPIHVILPLSLQKTERFHPPIRLSFSPVQLDLAKADAVADFDTGLL